MNQMPDYSRYSRNELLDIVAHVNRERFPERYEAVRSEIDRREQAGEEVVKREIDQREQAREEVENRGSTRVGTFLGPLLYTLEVYFGHLWLAPDLLNDGQYTMMIYWTVPAGVVLGVLVAGWWPIALSSSLLKLPAFWAWTACVLLIAGLFCGVSESVAALMPIYGVPFLLLGWLRVLVISAKHEHA